MEEETIQGNKIDPVRSLARAKGRESRRDLGEATSNGVDTKKLGFFAEGVARSYLIKKGYKILAANYKFNFGELDIVAQKEDIITFFEVKALNKFYEGFEPEMRVDYKKKNKLIGLATAFLENKRLKDSPWQIDIISVVFDLENKKAHIKHFKNAVNNY